MGRLGVYLIGVTIGLVLLATFKMLSWQQRQQQQAAPSSSQAPARP
jgi:hypothetical protein